MRARARRWRIGSGLVLLLLVHSAGAAQAGEWEQVLDDDDVKGYSREVEGSRILEFRSTLLVDAPIELVGEILRDVEGLKRASDACTEARIIRQRDRNHYTFYVAYSYPAPIADRDVVVEVSTRYDLATGRAIADLKAVQEPLMPVREGVIRITDFRAQFIIEYISRQKTGVVYTSRLDPAGSIPAFLVNFMSKRALRQGGDDLRAAAHEQKYLARAKDSPDFELVASIVGDEGRVREIIRNRLRELVRDEGFVDLLMADPAITSELANGAREVGEILLNGFGARESKRQAVSVLLRRLLRTKSNDAAVIARLAADAAILDSLLAGDGRAAALYEVTGSAVATEVAP